MPNQSKISANTLFHFTSSQEYLINILEHTFRPRYCWENPPTSNKAIDTTVPPALLLPMVCFCDIPLSQIKDHVGTYGRYAIGLTKEWGIENKVNPVFYTIPGTAASMTLRSIGQEVSSKTNPVDPRTENLQKDVAYLSAYTKLYKGKSYRNGTYLEGDVIFYNEREWRFVPPIEWLERAALDPAISQADTVTHPDLLGHSNKVLTENDTFKLSFKPNDIRYLILEREDEILDFVRKISAIKEKFSWDEKTMLTTKIISMEHIQEDF
jgi:hypothetical protein